MFGRDASVAYAGEMLLQAAARSFLFGYFFCLHTCPLLPLFPLFVKLPKNTPFSRRLAFSFDAYEFPFLGGCEQKECPILFFFLYIKFFDPKRFSKTVPDFFFIFYFFSLKRVVILSCSIVCVPLAGNGSKQAALVRRVFLFLFFERTLDDDEDDDKKCAEDKDDDDDVWWAQSPKDGKKEAEKDRPLDSKFWHNSPPPALSTSLDTVQ